MKLIFPLLIAQVFVSVTYAQSPDKMSYQALIRDNNNQLVTNRTIRMQISILQGTVADTAVYFETQTVKTNTNGLVTIEIGGGTAISGTFSSIDWADGPYYIKTETDPTGGTNYTIMGTSQLLSVPYALYAKTAGNGFNVDYNDLINTPDFTRWDKDSTDNITLSGNQTISGSKTFINEISVPEPTTSSHAVTKTYADGMLKALSDKGVITIDNEGNMYSTVRIGSQVWMSENLRTQHYNDGEVIPVVSDYHDWINQTSEVCFEMYMGNYYNWFVVESVKLCPAGWHVPSDAEWTILSDFLGGAPVAGGK